MTVRIIAGERRGALLKTPDGQETRPLRDRIREALFSMIRDDVRGAHILDAFAGCGAVALEAASNGAVHATMVELSPTAAAIIRQNVAKLRYADRTTLIVGASPVALSGYVPPKPFDMLFLMPPYHSALCDAVLNDAAVHRLSAPGAVAICEIHKEEPEPKVTGWKLTKDKAYGITRLMFYERNG